MKVQRPLATSGLPASHPLQRKWGWVACTLLSTWSALTCVPHCGMRKSAADAASCIALPSCCTRGGAHVSVRASFAATGQAGPRPVRPLRWGASRVKYCTCKKSNKRRARPGHPRPPGPPPAMYCACTAPGACARSASHIAQLQKGTKMTRARAPSSRALTMQSPKRRRRPDGPGTSPRVRCLSTGAQGPSEHRACHDTTHTGTPHLSAARRAPHTAAHALTPSAQPPSTDAAAPAQRRVLGCFQ